MKVILFICFAALVATAQGLDCYQCIDCENIGDAKPSTCVESPNETSTTTEISTVTVEESTTLETTTTEGEPPVPKYLGNGHFTQQVDAKGILRNYRSILERQRRDTNEPDWFCYEAQYKDNDNHKVNRGCVLTAPNNNKCPESLESSLPGSVTECKLCQNDGCNGSAVAKLSFLVLCFVSIAKLIA